MIGRALNLYLDKIIKYQKNYINIEIKNIEKKICKKEQ